MPRGREKRKKKTGAGRGSGHSPLLSVDPAQRDGMEVSRPVEAEKRRAGEKRKKD